MPLSDTTVRNAKPRDKQFKLYDVDGLYIIIRPNGSKWWRFKYQMGNKEKLLSFGTYPEITLKDARERRDQARKLVANGIDPSDARKAKRESDSGANSFEAVAREWAASHLKDKAASHRDKVIRRFEIYLFPWLGNKPINEISGPELISAVKRIESLGKLETAHRALQTSRQVFRYAVQTGRAISDATAFSKGVLPATTVKHMAAFIEPAQVAELLRAIDGFKGTFVVQCALRIAPMLFVRPGELRRARWSEINFEKSEWSYFVTKTKKNHLVPLATQAIAILRELHPLTGNGEYIFPGGHSALKPMSESAINAALKRMGYDTKTEITGHGFRAMARTLLHEQLEFDPSVIEHQLAHEVVDSLGHAYNRTKFIKQRKEMMQTWANYLDNLKSGSATIALHATGSA